MAASATQQESAILAAISSLFSKYGPTVLNGLIIVSTVSGQSIIKRITFTCPCVYPLNVFQASIYIFGPCVALFFFAVLMNQKTWRLVHGCCFRVPSAHHPLSTSLLYWTQIVGQASIAPVAWLFVSLLDGDYYSCLRAGEFCVGSALCANGTQQGICGACVCSLDAATYSFLQSQSQVLAWSLLIVVGLIVLIATCLIRMCDRYTFVQANYVRMYRETEQRLFEDISRDVASTIGRENSHAFFGQHKLLKEDWDQLSSLPTLEDPFMFPQQLRRQRAAWADETAAEADANYTTLQRWSRKRQVGVAVQQQQQQATMMNGGSEGVVVVHDS